MRLDYIKPFIEASGEILSNYIKDGIETNVIGLKSEVSYVSGIAALVAMTNDIVGNVIIDMTEDTASKMISLMGAEDSDKFSNYSLSTIQELINLIAALAVTKLEALGYDVRISPPVIVRGEDVEISMSNIESLHIKIDTFVGNFNILVAVESEKEL